jgi:hypothetical protein
MFIDRPNRELKAARPKPRNFHSEFFPVEQCI